MKRFIKPFRQLRGKLTLSYTLTSVAAFLLVEMLFFSAVLIFLTTHIPDLILQNLGPQAAQATQYIGRASTDPEPLAT
jgi:hypothetical protein